MTVCSQSDHPPYDPPTPSAPRTYVLAGDVPAKEPASVALAVLGELLEEAEAKYKAVKLDDPHFGTVLERLATLIEARDRVAAAEAAL